MADKIVRHPRHSTFAVDWFVVVVLFRIARDDVPRMNQAREVANAAEKDVDQRVSRAEADLDPDCSSGLVGMEYVG